MKVLIINGHPHSESLNASIAQAYLNGAKEKHEVEILALHELNFDPNLKFGYHHRMELEPDLLKAQELILWCDHLVVVHPVWWGGLPAILKGFFDRTFLPKFAFQYRENSVWWDKLLQGRSAEIIYTIDQPIFYYRLFNGAPGLKQLKKMTFEFCGFKVKRVTGIPSVRYATKEKITQWLQKIENLGRNL